MFTCTHCPNKKFSKIDALYDHQTSKHSRIVGSCPLCEARFPSRTALVKEHFIEHMLRCGACGKGFGTGEALQSHRQSKHPRVPTSPSAKSKPVETGDTGSTALSLKRLAFPCSHCESIFYSMEALLKHQADSHSIPCYYCDHQFPTYATRDQHEALHLEYKCKHCDWKFASENTLDQHVSDLHSSKCNHCGSQLSSVTARNQHYKSCKLATRFCYTCTPCNRKFSLASALHAHGMTTHRHGIWTRAISVANSTASSSQSVRNTSPVAASVSGYTGEQSLASPTSDPEGQSVLDTQPHGGDIEVATEDQTASCCPSCRIIYESYEDFRTHTCEFRKMEIPLHCTYCYSRFVDGASLENHLAERDSFSCTVCNVQFCSDDLLHDHLETHPKCRKCEASFADETELYRHTEVGHPVVVCWDCGGAVVSQESLDLHYASEHPSCTICGSVMERSDMLPKHLENEHGIAQAANSDTRSSSVTTCGSIGSRISDHNNICSNSQGSTPSFTSLLTQASSDEGYITTSSTLSVSSDGMAHSGADNSATRMQSFCDDKGSPTPSRSSRDLSPSHGYAESNPSFSIEYVRAEDNHVQVLNGDARSSPSSSTRSPGELSSSASSLNSESIVDPRESVLESKKEYKLSAGQLSGREFRLHCRICSRDPCEDMTATICGHLFCKRCITQAVVAKSECPVCKSATLLYCLFRLYLAA